MKIAKRFAFSMLMICAAGVSGAFAQSVQLSYEGGSNYILTERTDLRRYDNGSYKGLMSREVKAYIKPEKMEGAWKYQGFFYVSQDTRRAMSYVAEGVHDAISSTFTITDDGEYTMLEDCGYPSFRNFPVYPKQEIRLGDEWMGTLVRSVDPLEKNKPTKMTSTVLYKYTGDTTFNNEDVYVITAQWGTRYSNLSDGADPAGDRDLVSASGKHTARVLVSKKNGRAVLIKDTVDETFTYTGKQTVAFKGTISMFTEYPPTIDYTERIQIAKEIDTTDENIEYKVTDTGIQIFLYSLNFYPDSDQLLEADKTRVQALAKYLKKFDKNKILVTGHTARVGSIAGEKELSLQRAHSVVKELGLAGLNTDNFICQGVGGDFPVADNSTEEGRARNRRVEITILGDVGY